MLSDGHFTIHSNSIYLDFLRPAGKDFTQLSNMPPPQSVAPKWLLIISAVFALLELVVSVSLVISPQSVLEEVDLTAKGIDYVIYMWAARQFALGFIFAFATFKRSIQMLTIAYIFFLVMFVGDLVIGISQKMSGLIIAAVIMILISSAILYAINKRK